MNPDVVCIGEAMVLVAPDVPASVRGRPSCSLSPAGAEFNVAAHLAALGCDVEWMSALGDDPLAGIILDEARCRKVGTDLVAVDPVRPTGLYLKSSEPEGTRMLYYRKGSAASEFDLVGAMGVGAAAPKVVHTTGITPALSATALSSVEALLDGKVFGEAMVSFDVNHRPALWGDRDAAEVLLDIAQRSDIVFVGRDEAEEVWGVATAGEIRELIDGPAYLVVKDGAECAVEFAGDCVFSCPAPTVDVLEPVGAGDAFAAGWLAGYVNGADVEKRLKLGHFMASQALQHTGDIFPPVARERVELAVETPVEQWPKELVRGQLPTC